MVLRKEEPTTGTEECRPMDLPVGLGVLTIISGLSMLTGSSDRADTPLTVEVEEDGEAYSEEVGDDTEEFREPEPLLLPVLSWDMREESCESVELREELRLGEDW